MDNVPIIGSEPSTQLSLSIHAHVCALPGGTVILDLKQDRYLGLDAQQTQFLQGRVRGWPAVPDQREASENPQELEKLITYLVGAGLLVPALNSVAQVQDTVDLNQALISLGDEYEDAAPLDVRSVTRFISAFAGTRWALKRRSLFEIVQRAKAKKVRRPTDIEPDVSRMAALVGIFRRLRPLVFAAENRCLLHALTLLDFLNRNEIYPEWVIGVALQPWGAHSWIQMGPYLFDTNPEKVCRFKPILVV